jgi:hypothetical protein
MDTYNSYKKKQITLVGLDHAGPKPSSACRVAAGREKPSSRRGFEEEGEQWSDICLVLGTEDLSDLPLYSFDRADPLSRFYSFVFFEHKILICQHT